MIAKLKLWFAGLSRREQWLVGIAGALVALLILVYGIAIPAYRAIGAAQTELAQATERRGRLEALAAIAKTAPTGGAAVVVANNETIESVVSQGAVAAGFEVSDGAAAGNDEFAFRLASAKAGPLLGWLTGLEAQGISVTEIRLQAGEGGFVAADVRVRRRP